MRRAGLSLSLLCILALFSAACWAKEPVKFGILALRPKAVAQIQWQPLATALHQAIPDYDFIVETYNYDELQAAVAAHQVDFVLTNPGNYLLLDKRSGLSAPLLTLSNMEQGQAVSAMGGVIFTKAGRSDIRQLEDLRGKTVATTTTNSLGSYQMQAYELSRIGLKMERDIRVLSTGMPHDQVIAAVMNGRADAGFVRSGELERMADDGKLDMRQIQIVHREDLPGFPVAVSTQLYPEWPLSALPQMNKDLKRRVAAYLLTVHDNKQLTRAMHINGFDVPADYSSVETLLRELRMPPYDITPAFTPHDVWQRYHWALLSALLALSAIVLLAFNLVRMNRRLEAASQQLQELNRNLAATLQAIPDLMFEVDQQGTYLNIWAHNQALLYAQKELLLGHTVSEMLPTAAAKTVMAALEEAQRLGASQGQVIQLKLSKELRWFELSVSRKTGNDDSRHGYIVLSRDITERKRAEQTRNENEERLRLALSAAKQGWFDINVQSGAILVSPEYVKMLGYDTTDFHTDLDNWIGNLHPEDRDNLLHIFRACLASGEPHTMQYRRRNAHGEWLWISSVGQVTEWDEQHQPLRMVGVHTDISERKLAEAALQYANRSLSILSAVNHNLVHATDESSLLHRVCQTVIEQGAYRMVWVGYLQHDEMHSIRPMAQVGFEQGYLENAHLVWADVEYGRGTTGRAARTGEVQVSPDILSDDSMALWRDEAQRHGFRSCISLPLSQQGEVFGVLGIYAEHTDAFNHDDIELLREMSNDLAFGVKSLQARHERDIALETLSVTALQLERANEQIEKERITLAERVEERTIQLSLANKAKDAFLATMSHEIRTPLGGLLGMMELLQLSPLNHKQQDMLEIARHSGNNLLRIVDDILDWSKIEAGKLAIVPSPARLHDTLRMVCDTYTEVAGNKGLALRMRIDPALSAMHRYDPLRVAQILHNFTSNALKFTQRGYVELSATRVSAGADEEQIRLCVQDTGIGISPAQMRRLFEHYEQASADTARMYGGTGLGLAICRSLADLMGGTLHAESNSGQGSTFCLTLKLPVISSDTSPAPLASITGSMTIATPFAPLTLNGKAIAVLLVDDHPINRMLLKQQLEVFGVQVEAAGDGSEALELWREGHYDLVISDCHMPEMDGYEFTRKVRSDELARGLHHTPVIAWTANVLSDELTRSLSAGMDDMLTKPTELHALQAMLLKWLPVTNAPQNNVATGPPLRKETAVENPALMDFSVLRNLSRQQHAQAELLQTFVTHNRNDVAALNQSLQDGAAELLARYAHRIKGASRMVGATVLEKLCVQIEQAALQGDLAMAQKLVADHLKQTVADTESAISAYVNTPYASS